MRGEEIEGQYFRVSHLLSALKLAVCPECFDGRRTWMRLADEYFADYVDRYEEMKQEVRDYYDRADSGRHGRRRPVAPGETAARVLPTRAAWCAGVTGRLTPRRPRG